MPDRPASHASKRAEPPSAADSPADELRDVVRLDWVIYLVVVVMAVLILAGLFGFEANQQTITTLATFATGIITGILAYLRLSARAASGRKEKAASDEEKHGAE